MANTDNAALATRPAQPLAVYIGVVQFFFASTWIVYVIYLPKLVAQAGLPAQWTPWILLADQVIFALADIATGFWIDRIRRGLARFGGWILAVSAISCTAFLLVPWTVQWGAPVLFGILLVWAVTSSALRSPPWALLSRYAASPQMPWLSAIVLTGTALASAGGPYLGVVLRDVDPRVPFALSSLTLLATVAGLVVVERRLAQAGVTPPGEQELPVAWDSRQTRRAAAGYFAALLFVAAGFQLHFSLNSATQYLRFAPADQLAWLMPVFWVGFSIAIAGVAPAVRLFGAFRTMAGAAAIGACATLLAAQAPGLGVLVAAQLLAGASWAAINVAAYTLALDFGRVQREGTLLGLMFSVFALATFTRILLVASGFNNVPAFKVMAAWLPALIWACASCVLVVMVLHPGAAQPVRPVQRE